MSSFKYSLMKNREQALPYFFWLASVNDIGIRRYQRIQSFFSSPEEMYRADVTAWEKTGVFSKKQLQKLAEAKRTLNLTEAMADMKNKGINLVIFDEREYPERLREIPSPPAFLFTKGKLQEKKGPVVSVIGARECSMYGSRVAARIGELLAYEGVTLVSGMARGIDSIAQEACLKAGGYSLGVLGGGPDICYPRESRGLYSMLEGRGCIISEYAPGVNPQPQFFACRNRIISGLADVVCVIEAREKSGTMITVDAALEQGREVYAVPGRITDVTSGGCNDLIRQGAGIILSPENFLEELRNIFLTDTKKEENEAALVNRRDEKSIPEPENCEIFLLKAIMEDSFTYEEISLKTQTPSTEVLSICLGLVKKQILRNMGAGRFCLTETGTEVKKRL